MAAVIQNPLKALGDQFYKEAIEQCRSYNARLCAERSVRLPFLDSQTGVAQNNCYIWMERHHRSPGVAAGQMYTYPARCWRKKRRLHTSTDARLGIYGLHLDGGLMSKESLPAQSTTLEALLRGEGLDRKNNAKNDEESLLEIQVSPDHVDLLTPAPLSPDIKNCPCVVPTPVARATFQVFPADLSSSLAETDCTDSGCGPSEDTAACDYDMVPL